MCTFTSEVMQVKLSHVPGICIRHWVPLTQSRIATRTSPMSTCLTSWAGSAMEVCSSLRPGWKSRKAKGRPWRKQKASAGRRIHSLETKRLEKQRQLDRQRQEIHPEHVQEVLAALAKEQAT